jgi:hypothetical protein
MTLLKPPTPPTLGRRYSVRIAEPLAVTMERYAEFLGHTSVAHVMAQALEFVFRRDADFKHWLAEHPQPAQGKTGHQRKRSTDGGAVPQAGTSRANGRDQVGP